MIMNFLRDQDSIYNGLQISLSIIHLPPAMENSSVTYDSLFCHENNLGQRLHTLDLLWKRLVYGTNWDCLELFPLYPALTGGYLIGFSGSGNRHFRDSAIGNR